MKKIIAITLGLIFLLCACGEKSVPAANDTQNQTQNSLPVAEKTDSSLESGDSLPQSSNESGQQNEAVEPTAPDYGDFFMTVNGFSFGIMDSMENVLAALGEPSGGTAENASCAYQGNDYFYYFDSLSVEIMANEIDGVLRVTDIKIIDDMIKNPQGVTIGTKMDAATAAMGDGYSISGSVYSYVHGNTTVLILCGSDNCVKALEYTVSNSN